MWSLFSSDPVKNFAYEVLETIEGLEGKAIWSLHSGKKKATGDPVSIFAFDMKTNSETQAQIAKAAFKRIKTLRHPNILTYLDGLETDKVLYIVTETVVPLEVYLQHGDRDSACSQSAISWGLHQIVKGLSFLVNDCGLIHNNVCMASVFVDRAGEWLIGGLDFMYSVQGGNTLPPIKTIPALERYDPPERTGHGQVSRGEKWSADMWGLGCLIWEVFNGHLPKTASLKVPGKISKNLIPHYCELVSANPKSRPNPTTFIENCRSKGGFMNNSFVDSMLFLEEIQIKDQNEKAKFFSSLTPSLDSFPPEMCRHKILPQLINAFEYSGAGSAVLAPLFKVGRLLDTAEYQMKIVPCVIKLFSSPDRVTRVKLLQQIEFFVEHLHVSMVNDQIFPQIIQGFTDSNPMVRECTLKAMVHLAPKLSYKNLNEELMKHFARLQSRDDQGGIRTNTTICLGKVAAFLNPKIRQKILVSAFLRAMKDPFPHARQAGILAMAATQNYYYLQEVAVRLLPALCMITQDPDKGVRDQAFKAIKGFLSKLEKVSENADLAEDMEKEVMSGSNAAGNSASGWAGWAVSGMSSLTSKIYKTKNTNKGTTHYAPAPASTSPVSKASAPISETRGREERVPSTVSAPDEEAVTEEEQEDEQAGDGWDNDWGDMEISPATDQSATVTSTTQEPALDPANDGWEDDNDWGSLEDDFSQTASQEPASQLFSGVVDSGLQPASTYNWGQEEQPKDDFFSQVLTNTKSKPKPKSAIRSSPVMTMGNSQQSRSSPPKTSSSGNSMPPKPAASVSTEWPKTDDDWDNWESVTDQSDVAKKKAEREQRQMQRKQELQERREAKRASSSTGALKLGAKKPAQPPW